MLLREVYSASAHVAPHGAKFEYFDNTAVALNGNRYFCVQADGKSIRDRYEHFQKSFNRRDKDEEAMSGVDQEVTETDELFSMIREAREEALTQKSQWRQDFCDRQQRKLATGERLVGKPTTTGAVADDDDDNDNNSEMEREQEHVRDVGADDSSRRAKKRRTMNHRDLFERGMDFFGALLRQSDEAPRQLKEQKIGMYQRRLEEEERMREADIAKGGREREEKRKERERADERESRERVALEKIKMMMEMLKI